MDDGTTLPSISEADDNMSTTLTESSKSSSGLTSRGSKRTSVTSLPPSPRTPRSPTLVLPPDSPTTSDTGDVPGWPRLAQLMAEKPDFEAFPRFREENIKNLLYYQVEIDQLRGDLRRQEIKDRHKWEMSSRLEPEEDLAKYADNLIETRDFPNPKDRRQWDLVIKLRNLLKEYNEALLLHAQISALPEPRSRNMECLRKWLTRTDYGNWCIGGSGSDAWGPLGAEKSHPSRARLAWQLLRSVVWPWGDTAAPENLDLVSTHPPQRVDGLARWIQEKCIPCYEGWQATGLKGSKSQLRDPEGTPKPSGAKANDACSKFGRFHEYRDNSLLRFTSAVATVVSCVLPTVAIGVLTTARGTVEKLLYIGGFTALFAIGLMCLTNETSRVQIFTATAAFSAVLVVFVQNQGQDQ